MVLTLVCFASIPIMWLIEVGPAEDAGENEGVNPEMVSKNGR